MAVAREWTKNVFNLSSYGKLLWKSMAGGRDRNDNLMLHEDFLPGYKTREDLEFKKAVKLALTDDHKHLVRVECPSPHLGCGPARMLSARARPSISLTLQESAVSTSCLYGMLLAETCAHYGGISCSNQTIPLQAPSSELPSALLFLGSGRSSGC